MKDQAYINRGFLAIETDSQTTSSYNQEMSPDVQQSSNSNQIFSDDTTQISMTIDKPLELALVPSTRKEKRRISKLGFGHLTLEIIKKSVEEYGDEEWPQPTDSKLKKIWANDTLIENLIKIYGILLFLTGCILNVSYISGFSQIFSSIALGKPFNVVLMIVQLSWFAFIHIDVRRYINSITISEENMHSKEEKRDPAHLETDADEVVTLRKEIQIKRNTQKYGFTSGRHGGSFYLKFGAVVFCLGYLVHTLLNLAEKIVCLECDAKNRIEIEVFLFTVLQPIYAFYQLFFIFNYNNLIVNDRKGLSKFALMHSVAASLIFWIHTICHELIHDLGDHHEEYVETNCNNYVDCKNTKDKLSVIASYLYPFSIEYNILIVGFWILLWENIGKMERNTLLPSIIVNKEQSREANPVRVIVVDCSHTNIGLFAGILITVSCSIATILLFIFSTDIGLLVKNCTEFISLVAMTLVAILAYLKMRHLDITSHSMINIDNAMLYICMPSIFLYAFFIMLPAIAYNNVDTILVSIAQVIQVIVQTVLISDGLGRRSNSKSLVYKKPGKQFITFLVVANLALWLLGTFQIKTEAGNSEEIKYYGKEIWIPISRITLPATLFYRFHSSVCLVDIWKGGYEKNTEH